MSSLVSCLCGQILFHFIDFKLSHCLQRTNSPLSPSADPDTPVFSGSEHRQHQSIPFPQCLFSPPLDAHLGGS